MGTKSKFLKKFVALALAVSKWIGGIGGVILVSMMLITVFDVMLRSIGRPMSGTYDLVALGGALIIGFSIPYTTLKKGHIIVDVLTQSLSERGQKVLNICTRLISLGVCFLIGWHLIKLGVDYYNKHEGSQTLQLSFYPIAYGLAVGFFVQCLANIAEIFEAVLGAKKNE
ncbi:MAG TPA: TRAP transporter small permease [Thermodesulfobacteriota bacterium]|nr:TRAP transporter small permease [Thermodesulfobacteriota bacterium]